MQLRIELPTEVLIEIGPSATDRIYIQSTRFNDYETPYLELTNNGSDFSKIKPVLYGIMYGNTAMSKKTGEFQYQPLSSSRNDSFLKEFRFNSFEAAKKAYIKFHGKENYFKREIENTILFTETK